MKRLSLVVVGALVAVVVAVQGVSATSDERTVLEWDVMAPVVAPYTGAANPIRGVNGGGVPWRIDRGKGELRANGRLKVDVEGLVLVSTGANPSATFRALVSCLSSTGSTATTVNVLTGAVPATSTGDARIDAEVDLPDPCFAPIVFVTSGGGSWFAVTGVAGS
jgi:hypothetical protein